MAVDTSDGHPEMDYPEHLKTYHVFLKGSLYLVIGVVLIMVLLALFVV